MIEKPSAAQPESSMSPNTESGIKRFLEGAFDGSIQQPYNGIAQISHGVLPQMHIVSENENKGAFNAGKYVGGLVDSVALYSLAKGHFAGKGFSPAVTGLATGATWGAIEGGLLTPTPQGQNLFETRIKGALEEGFVGAAVSSVAMNLSSSLSTRIASRAALESGLKAVPKVEITILGVR